MNKFNYSYKKHKHVRNGVNTNEHYSYIHVSRTYIK